jgi:predicted acetyltransferase
MIEDQAITIVQAPESQKALLARLMQLYLHDFSEFAEIGQQYGDVNADGVFAYEYFESYWIEPERKPLLITYDQNFVGFALTNAWSASGLGTDHAIAEFFILRKYRRANLGTRAAIKIISERSG